jgi:hypothetical protein
MGVIPGAQYLTTNQDIPKAITYQTISANTCL